MAVDCKATTFGSTAGRRVGIAGLLGHVIITAAANVSAQQPAPGTNWDTGTRIDRAAPEKQPRAQPTPPANTTVVPRAPGETKADAQTAEIKLEAFQTADAQRIEQGLVWHIFDDPPQVADGAAKPKPKLIGTWRTANPTVRLAPGTYQAMATFGRAHLVRKLTVKAGPAVTERFVLNAGGLRISAVSATGEALPDISFTYDILTGDADTGGLRAKVVGGIKPGLIIRLNAGIYQIVSTYGDANSVVRADVTVEAGKLTEAVVAHHAAKVTFKLVNKPGGDALADTRWTIRTAQGERVRDSNGALPSHILSVGAYEVTAQNGDRAFKRSFVVAAGEPIQIEVVIPSAAP